MGEMLSFYKSIAKAFLSIAFARLHRLQQLSIRELTGQTAIVTGINSGISLLIPGALAKLGAAVHLACRLIAEQQWSTRFMLSVAKKRAEQGSAVACLIFATVWAVTNFAINGRKKADRHAGA